MSLLGSEALAPVDSAHRGSCFDDVGAPGESWKPSWKRGQSAEELAVSHWSRAMLWRESRGEVGSLQALSVSVLLLLLSKLKLAPLPGPLTSLLSRAWG